jgi:predicted dehydrogenase
VFFTSRSGGSNWQSRERLIIKRLNGKAERQRLPGVRPHGRRGVLAAFATAIRSGKEPEHFPSGRANLGTLAIIEASLKSSASAGASVRIADLLASFSLARPRSGDPIAAA